MNQLVESAISSAAMGPLDARQLFEARAEASSRGIPVIRFLEEVHGWAPDGLTAELGRLLHMPVLTMENLHALAPAFEKLPLAKRLHRNVHCSATERNTFWPSEIHFCLT